MCVCVCVFVCVLVCVYSTEKQNNGIVVMMLLAVTAAAVVVVVVGVRTEFRVVLVKKLQPLDGQWEVDVGRTVIRGASCTTKAATCVPQGGGSFHEV